MHIFIPTLKIDKICTKKFLKFAEKSKNTKICDFFFNQMLFIILFTQISIINFTAIDCFSFGILKLKQYGHFSKHGYDKDARLHFSRTTKAG